MDCVGHGHGEGIIPALAGNTQLGVNTADSLKDHPRSRGEYSLRGGVVSQVIGSSPLSRGIPYGGTCTRCHIGIIPALAGNTLPWRDFGVSLKDHPRSRGEYTCWPRILWTGTGSSPLSRGILRESQKPFTFLWIIPALAGNTMASCRRSLEGWDHPRSRGEYLTQSCGPQLMLGSSPLSRGIRCGYEVISVRTGIIPALAGNTSFSPIPSDTTWDHPRSRGEYAATTVLLAASAGSSPLSRGIPTPQNRTTETGRIIPALAGNTGTPTTSRQLPGDHPRSRGEYKLEHCACCHETGSSPLSRGILRYPTM